MQVQLPSNFHHYLRFDLLGKLNYTTKIVVQRVDVIGFIWSCSWAYLRALPLLINFLLLMVISICIVHDNQISRTNQFLSFLDSSYLVQLVTFPISIVMGILLTILSSRLLILFPEISYSRTVTQWTHTQEKPTVDTTIQGYRRRKRRNRLNCKME
jgi:hypothetical protein